MLKVASVFLGSGESFTLASPTSTMRSTSLARFLSLCIRANSTLSLSAIDVTLFAPPASGLKQKIKKLIIFYLD